jgi:uncharacterized protein YbjQ (UPF0145 family)
MPFGRRGEEQDTHPQGGSVSVSAGELSLPQVAQSRLQHIAAGGATAARLAASDYLTLDGAGIEPISVVMGLSVVHRGKLQLAGVRAATELDVYSKSVTMGLHNAVERMRLEAAALGADGVKIDSWYHQHFDGEEHEYSVVGTALRFLPRPGALRTPAGTPFVAYCTPTVLAQYLRAGLCPVDWQRHVCVYHVPHRSLRQTIGQTFQNSEVPLFTDAWYTARELALSRMQQGLEQSGAQLLLDVGLGWEWDVFGEHTVEVRANAEGWRRLPELTQLVPAADFTAPALTHHGYAFPTVAAPAG